MTAWHFSETRFSDDRVYRYVLKRAWGSQFGRYVQFIGLNPSTADETQDDPTIRRCINYAKAWGYDGLVMTNIFAFRATDPRVMRAHPEPIGPANQATLIDVNWYADLSVACWGAHGEFMGRGEAVRAALKDLHVLKLTKDGHPGHPLYLRSDLSPVAWVTP